MGAEDTSGSSCENGKETAIKGENDNKVIGSNEADVKSNKGSCEMGPHLNNDAKMGKEQNSEVSFEKQEIVESGEVKATHAPQLNNHIQSDLTAAANAPVTKELTSNCAAIDTDLSPVVKHDSVVIADCLIDAIIEAASSGENTPTKIIPDVVSCTEKKEQQSLVSKILKEVEASAKDTLAPVNSKEDTLAEVNDKVDNLADVNGKEDNKVPVNGKEDNQVPVNGKEDNQVLVNINGDNQVLVNGKEDNQAEVNGKEDTQAPVNGKEDNQAPVNGKEDNPAPVNGKEDNQVPVNGKEDNQAEVNGKEDTQAPVNGKEDNQAEVKGKEDNPAPVDGKEDNQVPVNGKEDNQAEVKGKEDNQAAVNGKEDIKALVKAKEDNQAPVNGKEDNQAPVNVKEDNQAPVNDKEDNQSTVNCKEDKQATVNCKEDNQALANVKEDTPAEVNDKEDIQAIVNGKEDNSASVDNIEDCESDLKKQQKKTKEETTKMADTNKDVNNEEAWVICDHENGKETLVSAIDEIDSAGVSENNDSNKASDNEGNKEIMKDIPVAVKNDPMVESVESESSFEKIDTVDNAIAASTSKDILITSKSAMDIKDDSQVVGLPPKPTSTVQNNVDVVSPIAAKRRSKPSRKDSESEPSKRDSYQETKQEIQDSLSFIKAKISEPLNSNNPSKEDFSVVEMKEVSLRNSGTPDYEPITVDDPDPVYESVQEDTPSPQKNGKSTKKIAPKKPDNVEIIEKTDLSKRQFAAECIPPLRPARSKRQEKMEVPTWKPPEENILTYLCGCFTRRNK